MTIEPTPTEIFERNRPRLFSIAYRMLGTVMDAEDIVQEAYLRWQQADRNEIRSPEGWITTVVTRMCINHLSSARVQREQYIGPWLPEPLVGEAIDQCVENSRLADSLSMAFLVLLESLTPTERAVFLLREVFAYEFAEIALIVEKSEANCRQILTRARVGVADRRKRASASLEQCERVLEQFLRAAAAGNIKDLLAVLADDVTVLTDGGGEVPAARKSIVGAARVANFIRGTIRKFGLTNRVYRRFAINGQPGLIGFEGNRPVQALVFEISAEHVCAAYILNNPHKLRHICLSAT